VTAVAFSSSGETLATADGTGHAYLWNAASRTLTATLTDPGAAGIRTVAFSPSGTTLAIAESDGHTYLWSIS
jgi:WD40 repeat protein